MNPFEGALELLRDGGWCKLAPADANGRHCLYGALRTSRGRYVVREVEFLDTVAQALFPWRAVARVYGARHGAVMAAVNDHPDTTQEDVELILKHAAYEWDLLHDV